MNGGRMVRITLTVWIAVVALLGCTTEEIEQPEPPTARLEVSPAALDFGPLGAGSSLTLEVAIRNTGNAHLALEDLFVEGSEGFTLDETDVDRLLDPQEETVLPVTFTAAVVGEAEGLLYVVPSDGQISTRTVTLSGLTLAQAIELAPSEWTSEDHAVGCEQEVEISITNVGSSPLALEDVVFAPTSDEFEFSYYFGPGTLLNPGEFEVVTVYYTPRDELPDTGYLHVYSDDPAHPDALAMQYGVAHLTEGICDTFEQEGNRGADVLWVVDNSASMDYEQTSLVMANAALVDLFAVYDIDYHLAVVTTDDPLFRGDVPVMTSTTPDIATALGDALGVGTGGSDDTEGLRMAWEALSSPHTDAGGPNDGFLRDEASLHVIFASDSDDESPDTVAAYVDALRSLVTDLDLLHLHAVVAPPAPRYEEAAASTGGTVLEMDGSWWPALVNIPWVAGTSDAMFPLSVHPVVETLTVSVNGTPASIGWDHDDVLNAIIFQAEYVPGAGDAIEVCYSPLGGCSD